MKASDFDVNEILKKISTENFETYNRKELLKNLFKILDSKISDIMKIYKSSNGKFLYRGMRGKPAAFIYTPRTDRKPLDTDPNIHTFFNFIFNKITDGKINRSNATFATADYDTANFYGNVYIIFPFNGFDYVFSESIRDLYNYYNDNFMERYYYGVNSYKSYPIIKYATYDRYGGYVYNIRLLKNKTDGVVKKLFTDILDQYIKFEGTPTPRNVWINNIKNKTKEEIIPLINDILIDYFRITKKQNDEKIENILDKYTIKFFDHESVRREFYSEIKNEFYFNKDLEKVLKTENEVMIRADKILAIDFDSNIQDIMDLIKSREI